MPVVAQLISICTRGRKGAGSSPAVGWKDVFRITICQLGPKSRLVFNWYRSYMSLFRSRTNKGLIKWNITEIQTKKIYQEKCGTPPPPFSPVLFQCALRFQYRILYCAIPSSRNLLQKQCMHSHAYATFAVMWVGNVHDVYNFTLPKL